MRINWISPLPPAVSGVAVYSYELIRILRDNFNMDIKAITPDRINEIEKGNSINIYSLGNHPEHERTYNMLIKQQGIVLIHDLNIHDLMYFLTMSKGKKIKYISYLLMEKDITNRDIETLLYSDFENRKSLFYKYNMITEAVLMNNHFIVHTDNALETIKSINPKANILKINHFSIWHDYKPLNLQKREIIISVFGYMSKNKKIEEIIKAFSKFIKKAKNDYLLRFVGKDADIDTNKLIELYGIKSYTEIISNASNDEYLTLMKESDFAINMRIPSNGEVSGNMIKFMGFGIPVASNITDANIPKGTYYEIDRNNISNSLESYFSLIDKKDDCFVLMGKNAYNYIRNECNAKSISSKIGAFISHYKEYNIIAKKKLSKRKLLEPLHMNDKIKTVLRREL